MGPPVLGLWPGLFSHSTALFHRLRSWECLCLPLVLRGCTQWGTKDPQSNLTHLVVMGYGRFTQLSFEIQLEGKVQVALGVKRGRKETWFWERGEVMIKQILCGNWKKESQTTEYDQIVHSAGQQNMVLNKHRLFVLDNRRKRAPLLHPRGGGEDADKVNNRICYCLSGSHCSAAACLTAIQHWGGNNLLWAGGAGNESFLSWETKIKAWIIPWNTVYIIFLFYIFLHIYLIYCH